MITLTNGCSDSSITKFIAIQVIIDCFSASQDESSNQSAIGMRRTMPDIPCQLSFCTLRSESVRSNKFKQPNSLDDFKRPLISRTSVFVPNSHPRKALTTSRFT